MLTFRAERNVKAYPLAMFVLMACTLNVDAETYYVYGLGGNDDNDGRSLAAPWRSIGKANSAAQAGDTVYIRGGTYRETIRPANSGTRSEYITYARYDTEEVIITGVENAVDLRNRSYVVVDGVRILGNHYWVNMQENSTYNIIQNCYMEENVGWWGISLQGESHYNKILNNTLIAYKAPWDVIYLREGPSHNVIEGNDVRYGAHGGINVQVNCLKNVIRKNRVWNPWHTCVNVFRNSDQTLVEGNILLDSGEDYANIPPAPGEEDLYPDDSRSTYRTTGRLQHNAIQLASRDCIIRGNMLVNNGKGMSLASDDAGTAEGLNNRIYGNTFFQNHGGMQSDSKRPVYGNVFKNNLFYGDYEFALNLNIWEEPRDNYWSYNNISDSKITYLFNAYTLDQLQASYPQYFSHNRQQDPLFVNPGAVSDHDNINLDLESLYLRSDSPMINVGPFLTATTSAGSGNTIPVKDASYFYDGWGIPGEQGDLIQLEGQTQTARITSVDYDNNRITVGVDKTLTWDAGKGVSLAYHGDAPNIGAFEGFTLSTSATGGTVTKDPDRPGYARGEKVILTATADPNYVFARWEGDVSDPNANPTTITMDSDKVVTAVFGGRRSLDDPVTLTIIVDPPEGGSTTPAGQTSYDPDVSVPLTATANAGYEFAGWLGDLSGSTNPATITMDSNKSVTASFVPVAGEPAPPTPSTYTLSASATYGSVTKTPDQSSYNAGDTVTLAATPDIGYSFGHWSGDASGTTPSATVTMDSDKLVTANFTANTYTLTTAGTNGSVTKTPNKASYTHGETVTVQAVAESGYSFAGWSGDLSGSANPAAVTMNADKSITASFTSNGPDQTPPVVVNCSPEADVIQVPLNSLVTLHISDDDAGVDADTVTISLNGAAVYAGDVASYDSASGICHRTGTEVDYAYAYQSKIPFDFGEIITVTVNAADLDGNVMSEHAYSFTAEMRTFSANLSISSEPTKADKGRSQTVTDSAGNTWVVWQAGSVGARDVYVSKLPYGASSFDAAVPVTRNGNDQANPDIAIGTDDRLYVVWQDNRRGNWDVYVSTSVDGATWSQARLVADYKENAVNPVIVVDGQSPNRAYVAWQGDRDGSYDIYVASSINAFVDSSVSQVTMDAADQTDPDVAVDGQNTVYVVWTDVRNGLADVYGAASNAGPWSNIPIVAASGNQTGAVIAIAAGGSLLHALWVDDRLGDTDIYYASSEGLPESPLSGSSIVDDTLGAEQIAPAIVCTYDGKAIACWEDFRHANVTSSDSDLFLADLGPGISRTNVLIGDDSTNSSQSEPALGVDYYGHPYVVWTDGRHATTEVYYAASVYAEPIALASQLVTMSTGGTVGGGTGGTSVYTSSVDDLSISSEDDATILVPPQACPFDVTMTISRILNSPVSEFACYEFGPSGLVFEQPVTVVIPYSSKGVGKLKPVWYDSITGGLSEEGITEIVDINVGPGLRALQFTTTHFTPFFLVSAPNSAKVGGGCALSYARDQFDPLGYLVPYALLAIVMVGLRLRDAWTRKSRLTRSD